LVGGVAGCSWQGCQLVWRHWFADGLWPCAFVTLIHLVLLDCWIAGQYVGVLLGWLGLLLTLCPFRSLWLIGVITRLVCSFTFLGGHGNAMCRLGVGWSTSDELVWYDVEWFCDVALNKNTLIPTSHPVGFDPGLSKVQLLPYNAMAVNPCVCLLLLSDMWTQVSFKWGTHSTSESNAPKVFSTKGGLPTQGVCQPHLTGSAHIIMYDLPSDKFTCI
jgi:hypothetical protein